MRSRRERLPELYIVGKESVTVQWVSIGLLFHCIFFGNAY